jgi:hypothetical protein
MQSKLQSRTPDLYAHLFDFVGEPRSHVIGQLSLLSIFDLRHDLQRAMPAAPIDPAIRVDCILRSMSAMPNACINFDFNKA